MLASSTGEHMMLPRWTEELSGSLGRSNAGCEEYS